MDATLEDVALARAPFAFVHGGLGFGPGGGLGPAGRPGGARGIGVALSGTWSVTFYDAAKNEQTAYDSLTTARMHVVVDIAGDVARGVWTGTVERTRDMEGSFIQKDVVVPVPGSASKYPRSGTVTRKMKVKVVNGLNGGVDQDVTAVITFDGDNTATAVVDGETYEIDLDARPGDFPLGGGVRCAACRR